MIATLHWLLFNHILTRQTLPDPRWAPYEDPEAQYHREACYALVRVLDRVEGFARVQFES